MFGIFLINVKMRIFVLNPIAHFYLFKKYANVLPKLGQIALNFNRNIGPQFLNGFY
jgi:hypothetical protein